jgi:hypothetical protein
VTPATVSIPLRARLVAPTDVIKLDIAREEAIRKMPVGTFLLDRPVNPIYTRPYHRQRANRV